MNRITVFLTNGDVQTFENSEWGLNDGALMVFWQNKGTYLASYSVLAPGQWKSFKSVPQP